MIKPNPESGITIKAPARRATHYAIVGIEAVLFFESESEAWEECARRALERLRKQFEVEQFDGSEKPYEDAKRAMARLDYREVCWIHNHNCLHEFLAPRYAAGPIVLRSNHDCQR